MHESMDCDVKEIKTAVIGDGENKRGLIMRVSFVEKDIGVIKWVAGLGTAAAIATFISQWIGKAFHG